MLLTSQVAAATVNLLLANLGKGLHVPWSPLKLTFCTVSLSAKQLPSRLNNVLPDLYDLTDPIAPDSLEEEEEPRDDRLG